MLETRIDHARFLSCTLITSLALTLAIAPSGVMAIPGEGECVEPPDNLIGWWPFDECDDVGECPEPIDPAVGQAEDVAQDNNGNYIGTVGLVGGKVGGAISPANGFVQVPHDDSLNLEDDDFSIELWALGAGTLVEKRDGATGYELEIDPVLGVLRLLINSNEVFCDSGWNPGGWIHIGVTVNRDAGGGPTEIRCYRDGLLASGDDIMLVGSVDTTVPLNIGSGGRIDELTIYDNDLPASTIAAIAEADNHGKCKEGGYAPWDKPFCFRDDEIEVSLAVCNYGTDAQTYDIKSILPLPTSFHSQCNIAGPTEFTATTPMPILVAPSACEAITMQVKRPGFVEDGDVGCYEVTFQNEASGATFGHAGSVWSTDNQCTSLGEAPPLLELQAEQVGRLVFEVSDTGRGTDAIAEIRAVRSDMTKGPIPINLNGQKAGTPVRQRLVIPRGGTTSIPVTIAPSGFDPFRTFDILLVLPNEGRELVLQSTGVRVLPGSSRPDSGRRSKTPHKP